MIDPSIPLQAGRGVTPLESPFDLAGKALQLRGMLQQQKAGQLQFEQIQQQMRDAQELRMTLDSARRDGMDPVDALSKLGSPIAAQTAQHITDMRAKGVKLDGEKYELATKRAAGIAQRFAAAASAPGMTPDGLRSIITQAAQNGELPQDKHQELTQSVPNDPRLFRQWGQLQLIKAQGVAPQILSYFLEDSRPITDIGKLNKALKTGEITEAQHRDAVKKATSHGSPVTISYSQPFEVTDPETGKRKLVQQDREGNIREVKGYAPKDGSKPLSEAQGNALGFGIRAREADAILTQLEERGSNVAGGAQRVVSSIPGLGNYLTPPDLQEYEQAKRNFVTAVLRKESGAAISAGEFATEDKKYFPQPGDSSQVIKQKAEARKTAIGVLQLQAGRDLPEDVRRVKPVKPQVGRFKELSSGELSKLPPQIVSDYLAGKTIEGPDGTRYKKGG